VIQFTLVMSNAPCASSLRSSDHELEKEGGNCHSRVGMTSCSRHGGEDNENGSGGIEEPDSEDTEAHEKDMESDGAEKESHPGE
jgi:hypothetical protein